MNKKGFTEEQIIGILKAANARIAVTELCREHGMSNPTFYKWRASTAVRANDTFPASRHEGNP